MPESYSHFDADSQTTLVFAEVAEDAPNQPPAPVATVLAKFPGSEVENEDLGLFNLRVPWSWYWDLVRDGHMHVKSGTLWIYAEHP